MKLWLVISLLVALVHSAPTTPQTQTKVEAPKSTQSTEDLMSAIQKIQNKFKLKTTEASKSEEENSEKKEGEESEARDDRKRKTKMLNYFGYFPPQLAIPTAAVYPSVIPTVSNFYPMDALTVNPLYNYDMNNYYEGNDFEDSENQEENNEVDTDNYDYNEEIYSRVNKRRPGQVGGNRNSQIFYIRIPPTPYMFVPGMGYISNHPTITPMPTPIPTPLSTMNPYLPNPYGAIPTANPYLQQANPFINLPLNFVSNGKPVGVYQFPSTNRPYQPSTTAATRPSQNPNGALMPNRKRPYRPNQIQDYSRPDSKITTLKGQYLFNGRPEEIYLLQNLQTTPYTFPYLNPLQTFY